jgi:chitinase
MATLSVEDIVVGEGDPFVDVVVRLSEPVAQTVTVNYQTSNGTAGNTTDYNAVSGSLSFASGETTKTVRVNLVGGTTPEALEHFFLSVNTPVNATIAKSYGLIEVVDNDAVVDTPQIFVRDAVVDEAAGKVSFVVMLGRSGGQSSTSPITVDYTTANGTATAGSDYTAVSNTLTFAPGESVKTIVVDITDDALAEGLERFHLVLSNATNASIGDGLGVATIGASDGTPVAQPRISIADQVVGENEGYTDVVVTLSAPGQSTVSVNYTMSNGTAGNTLDYSAINGSLTFAPGETTKTIRVPLLDGTTPEAMEHFFVSLRGCRRKQNLARCALIEAHGREVLNGEEGAEAGVGTPGAQALVERVARRRAAHDHA